MSNATIPGSSLPAEAAVIGADLRLALNFMSISTAFGATLFNMLLALLFVSTPVLRRKPVFILNVASLLLGIGGAGLSIFIQFHSLVYPSIPLHPAAIIAFGVNTVLTPALVDLVLLLRLYSIHPYQRTPFIWFCLIFGVPIIITIGRVVNGGIYLKDLVATLDSMPAATTTALTIYSNAKLPSIKIEWALQLCDDIWLSTLFIIPVYKAGIFDGHSSLIQKLRTLFWIAASNFAFPLVLNIIQLALYISRPDLYTVTLYIEEVNIPLTVIGVVFATLWVAKGQRDSESHRPRISYFGTESSIRSSTGPSVSHVRLSGATYVRSHGQISFNDSFVSSTRAFTA